MQITGNIIAVLPERTGTSARGTQWASQDFVIEIPGQYPQHVCLNIFGADKIQQLMPVAGEPDVTVQFDIDAREHNGRWYNQLRCWNITRPAPAQQSALAPAHPAPAQQDTARQPQPAPAEDNLPF